MPNLYYKTTLLHTPLRILFLNLRDKNYLRQTMRGRYILMLAALLSCVSCLKDDNTYKTPQAAITSFTIGYYNVRFHDMNIHGRDTMVYLRESGYMYPMTIDQVNNRIFNADSMAYGSDLSKVTTSVY